VLRKIFLPTIFAVLAYGFWISPDFKEIAAGVAIFLFGMLFLERGFKVFTGGTLETILRLSTDRLWKSLGFGMISTSVTQSSSLVSVITISFLSAGLIGLSAGIGIIFGANLGTTTGAWLVAGLGLKVNIAAYAMPMLVFGVILVLQKPKPLKGIGYLLAGLGFLFLGIHYMKEGFEAFKDSIDLAAYAIPGLKGLLVFTLIGVFATVVMQSSHATLVLIITALAAQQISYENALALAIGANVGTTITAMLGAMSASVDGKRLALAHLIFNVATGLIAIVFIQQFLAAVNILSAAVGIAPDNDTLRLAVFHTLFNLAGIIVMLPFTTGLVRLLQNALPEKTRHIAEPHFLNDAVLEMPDAAIEAARNETRHLFDNAFEVMAHALNLSPASLRSARDPGQLIDAAPTVKAFDIDAAYELRIKPLYSAIFDFISRAQANASAEESDALYAIRSAGQDIVEAVKEVKHLQKNLIRYLPSRNADVRRQYNGIRLRVAEVLREIAELGESEDPELAVLSLDGIKLDIEESDLVHNGELDRLIRQQRIGGEMATSLMNDSAYAYTVVDSLIAMARIVFSPVRKAPPSTEEELGLDDTDIQTMLRPTGSDRDGA
jgi:phosphate:Na+ symporter